MILLVPLECRAFYNMQWFRAVSPIITSVSPTSGTKNGGTVVTIKGSRFPGNVNVNGFCNGIHVTSGNSLTCTTIAHAKGTITVTLSNAAGSSKLVNAFKFN